MGLSLLTLPLFCILSWSLASGPKLHRTRMGDASLRCVRAVSAPAAPLTKSGDSVVQHLSPVAEAALRLLPGNDRCADCKAIYPQWAGVSFGVLLCIACAGKHRALGVSVSFVKSLAMDSWSSAEQRALEVGGNGKWAAVCAGTGVSDLLIPHKYSTPVAEAYKNRIIALTSPLRQSKGVLTANEFLAQLAGTVTSPSAINEVAPELASPTEVSVRPSFVVAPSAPSQVNHESVHSAATVEEGEILVKCTTCQHGIPLDKIDSHSKQCVVHTNRTASWRKYDREFGRPGESLGFSLTKTTGGFAEITRVTAGGAAERANVIVGSYIVGVNEHKSSVFEELVPLVSSLPRPIHFHFVFRVSPTARSTSHAASISSVPEPISVETEAVFDASVTEIGCVLQVQNNRCLVMEVDPGSAAQRQGVLVGSCVAAVNGRPIVRGVEAIEWIQKGARPLRITFHRVEGLMRGWKSS